MRPERLAALMAREAILTVEDWAASGAMWLTGHADGPPQLAPGDPATAVRRDLLGLRAIAASVGADGSRIPDERILGERAALTGLTRNGRTSCGGATRLLDAADGTVAIALARATDLESVPALTESPVDGDPWDAMARWCAATPAAEIVERASLLGMAASQLLDAQPALGPIAATSLEAPRLQARPLTVVDLSALWAGPLAAHLLHLLGARVIGVESPRRPDPTRFSQPEFYRLLHNGTEQQQIDFATPEGRGQLLRLIATADIVIESSRPRALQQLGIDAAQIVADHPVVWVSITAYGRDDPRIGFGDDVAIAAGMAGRDAHGGPVFAGDAIADPIAGVRAAAVAQLSALRNQPGLVEVSMYDSLFRSVREIPDATVVEVAGKWYVETENELILVAPPTAQPRS
jgi:hypothetical protein